MRELKAEAVRQMTHDEVQLKIRELREELFNLRFRNAMRQLDNPLRIRWVRRAIARFETVLAEDARGLRKLAGEGAGAPSGKAAASGKTTAVKKASSGKAADKATASRKTVAAGKAR